LRYHPAPWLITSGRFPFTPDVRDIAADARDVTRDVRDVTGNISEVAPDACMKALYPVMDVDLLSCFHASEQHGSPPLKVELFRN